MHLVKKSVNNEGLWNQQRKALALQKTPCVNYLHVSNADEHTQDFAEILEAVSSDPLLGPSEDDPVFQLMQKGAEARYDALIKFYKSMKNAEDELTGSATLRKFPLYEYYRAVYALYVCMSSTTDTRLIGGVRRAHCPSALY